MKKILTPMMLALAAALWIGIPALAEAGCGKCGGGAGHKHEADKKECCGTCTKKSECTAEKKAECKAKCAAKSDCKDCKDGELCKACAKACADKKAECGAAKSCPMSGKKAACPATKK